LNVAVAAAIALRELGRLRKPEGQDDSRPKGPHYE